MISAVRTGLVHARRLATARPRIEVTLPTSVIEYGEGGFDTFFGYHDVTPFSPDGASVLAMRRKTGGGARSAGTPVELGCFDLVAANGKFHAFGTSTAWCWQQGCRLQWQPGTDASNTVFFNVSRSGRHESCYLDVTTGYTTRSFDRALYALSPDGRFGISLNFPRLQRLRPGYGYGDLADPTCSDPAPQRDGLWLVNLSNGGAELRFSLAEAAAYKPDPSMAGAEHYFNHVVWNPDSTRFFFIHLWLGRDGKRRGRAFIWDIALGSYWLLGPDRHVSHQCWIDRDRLVVFSTERASGTHYHLYHCRHGCQAIVGEHCLVEDGHPSISPADPDLMVTDTYPDRLGERSLLIFNLRDNSMERIARLYSATALRGEMRCDLHPRWNCTGDKIAVDSSHAGRRQLCVVDVENTVSEFRRAV